MKKLGRLKRLAAAALTVVLVIAICLQFAYATDVSTAKANFQDGITTAYRHLRNIALGGGALALAGCGIIMLMGSQQDAEKAKAAIKFIIVAVVGVLILPLIVRAGKGLFGATWNPRSLG